MTVTRINAGWVVGHRQDVGHTLIEDGVVVYDGDQIMHVGDSWDGRADVTVDAPDELLIPGLINLHTHAFSPLTRSFLEDLGSRTLGGSTTLYKELPYIRSGVGAAEMSASIRFSVLELLKGGSTTVVFLQTSNDSKTVGVAREIAELCAEWGLRAYVSPMHASGHYNLRDEKVEYSWDEQAGREALDAATAFIRELEEEGGLVRGMLGPRQTALCSPELLRSTAVRARELQVPVQVHTCEALPEVEEVWSRYGKSPVEYLHENELLNEQTILGHCIYVREHSFIGRAGSDIKLIAESGATIAHCPWIFARRGTKVESLGGYLRAGINVGIGTDTFPQDILSEMRWALTVGKLAEQRNDAVSLVDIFDCATTAGARALRREDIGRLAPGAQADIVAVKMSGMRMSPVRDPLKNLLYSASAADVCRVVVAGRTLIEGGSATFVDEEAVAEELQAAAGRTWKAVDVEAVSPMSLPAWWAS